MYLRGTRKISWVELLTGRRLWRDWSDSGRRSPHVVLVVTLSCWHRGCVFLCTTREFFGQQVERLHPSYWAQRGCSAHSLCQHLHEVNQRGPEVIVTSFPCQSGRYFAKTTVNALLREAELHITSGELQHPLRHHQFIRRCKFALRRPHYY